MLYQQLSLASQLVSVSSTWLASPALQQSQQEIPLAYNKAAGAPLQNVSVEEGTSFVSVQRVPTTTKALKQAVTMQPVIVGVDASDWSYYYSVSTQFSRPHVARAHFAST